MAPSSIEVKVISCKGLKVFNFFQKLSTYSTISIVSLDPKNHQTVKKRYQQQKTPIDREGDGNPEWNYQAEFDLNQIQSDESLHSDHLFLQFDILCEGGLFGDKTIGLVRVPIKDLIEEGTGGAVRFVCYQVMTTDGKPNDGVLDFSYKVIGADTYPVVPSVHSLYPPLESILFPPPPLPIPQVYYPPPSSQDLFYASPPQTSHFPAPEVYYQPPPPPPPVIHYPVPPSSYAPPAYSCHECRYPTVDPY